MNINLSINNIETNTLIEICKIGLPPLIVGILGLVPYLNEKKNTKEKELLHLSINDLKALKVALQQYYQIVNAYRYSTEKREENEINDIIDSINDMRFTYNKNLENCIGLLNDKDYVEFEEFSNQFIISDVKTRNNLLKNEKTDKFQQVNFIYENTDDNFEINKNLYHKLIKIINKQLRNL